MAGFEFPAHWAELVNLHSARAHLDLCNLALAEVQAETRRRDLNRLEAWIDDNRDTLDRGFIDGLEMAVLVLKEKL